MKRFYLTLLLFAVLLSGIIFHYKSYLSANNNPAINTDSYLLYCNAVIPQADKCIKGKEDIPYFKAYKINKDTKKEELIGLAFITTDIAPEIRGYSGPIKIIVGINLDGVITNINIISHSETPNFVKELDNFIKQFKGKSYKDPIKLNKNIDAMTGATITSSAIVRSIKKSLDVISSKILKINLKEESQNESIPIEPIVIPIILFAFAIYNAKDKQHKYKWFILIFSLVYLGTIKGQMLSIIQIANIGLLRIPTFASNPLWYMLIILALLSLLFFGNIYCASICPFGIIQEIFNIASRKFRLKKIKPSANIIRKSKYGRYFILFGAIILSYIVGSSNSLDFETFVILFSSSASILGTSLVALMLITSLFHFKFWCRYLCPVGSFNSLIPKLTKKYLPETSQNIIKQKSKKLVFDDKIFLLILTVSYLLILSIIISNFANTNKSTKIEIKTQSNTKITENVISDKQKIREDEQAKKIKDKLKSLNIKPHSAKYWRQIENEQNSPVPTVPKRMHIRARAKGRLQSQN